MDRRAVTSLGVVKISKISSVKKDFSSGSSLYFYWIESASQTCASLSLDLSLCVYLSLSLSSLGSVDSVCHQLSENIWFDRLAVVL